MELRRTVLRLFGVPEGVQSFQNWYECTLGTGEVDQNVLASNAHCCPISDLPICPGKIE